MSSSPGSREVAHRLFAAEFDDADHSYSESDEERAPNYVVTPTGARVNRLFFVGVLTETERVNEDMLRARVVDPTGAFVAYAGQYQPDELAFLERVESPAFLAVTGKARTFQPEDSDRVYTSARPESISRVDAETRDRWVVQAAERTLDRVRVLASAIESGIRGDALEAALVEAGVDASLAQGAALALDHYGTTPAYLAEQRDLAVQAVETVTGDRDEVDRPSLAPDEGDGDAASMADPDLVDALAAAEVDVETAPVAGSEQEADVELEAEPEAGAEAEAEAETEPEPETEPEAEAGEDSEADPEPVEATTDAGESAEPAGGSDGAEDDDLGDFEPGEFDGDEVDEEDLDDALTDEERQEVEDNFDTDFSTGNELDEGDADPAADADPVADEPEGADRPAGADEGADEQGSSSPRSRAREDAAPDAEGESVSPGEPDAEVAPASDEDPEAQFDEEPEPSEDLDTGVAAEAADAGDAGEVDLEAAVLDAMSELDDGDGADHDAVVEAVVDEHAVAVDDAEAAIEDALMSGQCYEPADGKLKPI